MIVLVSLIVLLRRRFHNFSQGGHPYVTIYSLERFLYLIVSLILLRKELYTHVHINTMFERNKMALNVIYA